MSIHPDTAIEACTQCGQLLDLREMAPLTVAACPVCTTPTTVHQELGPYLLERLLSDGGLGAVYLAKDTQTDRPVALKVLRQSWSQDAAVTSRFEREANLAARVRHPNVARVYGSGTVKGVFYIAMELVPDGSLESWMETTGPLPEKEVLEMAFQVTLGLRAALKAGLIHRDIKPANILFTEGRQARIVDFGIALPLEESPNPVAEIWGTPNYIAPEILEGKAADLRSDLYSLGATMWHALAGKTPHQTDTTSVSKLLAAKKSTPRLQKAAPWISPETSLLLERVLSFRPDDRYPDYESFLIDLRKAIRRDPNAPGNAAAARGAGSLLRKIIQTPLLLAGCVLGAVAVTLGTLALRPVLWSPKPAPVALSKPPTPRTLPKEPANRVSNASAAGKASENRLIKLNQYLASGQLDQSVPLLELIQKAPETSPRAAAWCRVSLVIAYTLQGKKELRAQNLEFLALNRVVDDPVLNSVVRSLPGNADAYEWTREEDPAVEAFRQMWAALLYIWDGKWTPARRCLAVASRFDYNQLGHPELVSLLPLAPVLDKELEALVEIRKHLTHGGDRHELPKIIQQSERLIETIQVCHPIKIAAQNSISKAKAVPVQGAPGGRSNAAF